MHVEYAVLGALAAAPRHGYALRAELEARWGARMDLGHGRVYRVLARLEAKGLVSCTEERIGRRLRKVYAIAPMGRLELRSWARDAPSPANRLALFRSRLLWMGGCAETALDVVEMEIRRTRVVLGALVRLRGQLDARRGTPLAEIFCERQPLRDDSAEGATGFADPDPVSGVPRASGARSGESSPGRRAHSTRASRRFLPSSRPAS